MFLRFITVIALSGSITAFADTPTGATAPIVQSIERGNIRVHQPRNVTPLLQRSAEAPRREETSSSEQPASNRPVARTGYRVQVFDDNNPRTARSQAEAFHARLQAEFPHAKSYITFNSPYWRVKVGDYRTRAEAEAAMTELRHAFPSMGSYMRIVRDRINTAE